MSKKLFFLLSLLVAASLVLAACAPAPAETPVVETQPAVVETEPPKAAEVTLWHSYHTGENEEKAINQLIEQYKGMHPEVTVNVLAVPFDQLFNKWETEVAAGGGPDMFTAPNDNLGNEARGTLVAPLDDLLSGKLDGFSTTAVEGSKVDGVLYAVPGIIKAVGLFYNTTNVPEPPKTVNELMQMVQDGKKIAIMQYGYHNFGFFTGSFGGTLMDDTGKCVADQGGFADAMQYLADLKAAGANFETDEGKANTMFQQGEVDMIISGPWMLGTFKDALGDKLGVAPMPAGPAGAASPLTGVDGWYINPNSKNKEAAIDLALFLFGPDGAKVYADMAGDPPGRTDVEVSDALVKAFSDVANAGFPRPQSVEFGNWWGPFGDAFTKVMEGQSTPEEAVAQACTDMNTASGK